MSALAVRFTMPTTCPKVGYNYSSEEQMKKRENSTYILLVKERELPTYILALGPSATCAGIAIDGIRNIIAFIFALICCGCINMAILDEVDTPGCFETTLVSDFVTDGDNYSVIVDHYGDVVRRGYTITEAAAVDRGKRLYSMSVCANPESVVRFEIRRADIRAPACGNRDSLLYAMWGEKRKNDRNHLLVDVKAIKDLYSGPYCEVKPIYPRRYSQ